MRNIHTEKLDPSGNVTYLFFLDKISSLVFIKLTEINIKNILKFIVSDLLLTVL